ncbi:unnamed protein product [Peronospora destructor]|uniref:Cyclin N-terminal domain-containing protein n=1 Tax=Peronospora destructor TaxID=86335 RepID=A0AAV0V4H5_9STRA|nr:unnamed protein product [Peronospora destructor]
MTTTSGHSQTPVGPSSQHPQRFQQQHHRVRGSSKALRHHQDDRKQEMGYRGYTGGYASQQSYDLKMTQMPTQISSGQKVSRQYEVVQDKQRSRMDRDEELAGRPAMIAMNQDELPFTLTTERQHGDRKVETQTKSRHHLRPMDEYRGKSKIGSFHGNCRSSRPLVNEGNNKHSYSGSRGRSATTIGPLASNNHSRSRDIDRDMGSRPRQLGFQSATIPHACKETPTRALAPFRSSLPGPKLKKILVNHWLGVLLLILNRRSRTITTQLLVRRPGKNRRNWWRLRRVKSAIFFSVMENNIRLKLRDGYYTRDSETSNLGHNTPDAMYKGQEMSSCRSSASTASTRSSLSSYASGSGRSLPGSARQLILNATRSLPTTPEGMGVPYVGPGETTQPQQEPESLGRDSENNQDASKRPSLFRTLSSYETPVMNTSRKGSDGLDVDEVGCHASTSLAAPSPIQERVRLAALAPRVSDLEAHARAVRVANGNGRSSLQLTRFTAGRGSSASALVNRQAAGSSTAASADKPRALRRRSNSTNSIYLRMGTMDVPDQDATIQCVATVLRAHMMEAFEDPIRPESRFDIFVTARDRQRLPSIAAELDAEASTFVEAEGYDVMLDVVPTLSEIETFVKHVFSRAQMESECIIMSLVYVERLLKATSGFLQLRGENWRRLVFCSMVMASKVWDDLSMTNADFSKIWPELSLKQINELELVYLSAVEYNVRVSAASYAKYYFHLRSMCASMGLLEAFDESAPLNLDGARKMQVLSEEYQERSKLMPVPRRRSVTITTTSATESMQAGANACRSAVGGATVRPIKASPAASLEQLVRMQVRVAGGRSPMHRLSAISMTK